MIYPDNFSVTTPSDLEIEVTRDFHAPRALVFDAFTRPELVRQWLLGPDGWSMPVCEIDLRVGGKYRYVWRRDSDGTQMGMGGEFHEISVPEKTVATERFDQSWYPGGALDTTLFVAGDALTHVTINVRYESRVARDAARASGMEQGMATGYDRLADLLAAWQLARSPAKCNG